MSDLETKKLLHIVSFTLVILGALNWALFGLFNVDLVETLLGGLPTVAEIVYVLIGAGGVYLLATHAKDCKTCAK